MVGQQKKVELILSKHGGEGGNTSENQHFRYLVKTSISCTAFNYKLTTSTWGAGWAGE